MKNGEMLNNALRIMVNAHDGQYDRGGNPYALHPLKVAELCKTNDEELLCICYLHDVVEDSDVAYSELKQAGMSDRVIAAIKALTKQRGQSYDEYIEAVCENTDAMKVKLADLTHNSDIRRLKGVRDKDIERIIKYQRFYTIIKERLESLL